ncbi:MAG: hypothetical protein ACOY4P_15230 [Pseudomonadota bacterium]
MNQSASPLSNDELAATVLARLRVPSPPSVSDVPPPTEPPPTADLDAILGMPLADFGRRHLALRVRLPDGSECWFCSGADEVAVLRGEGIARGAIWTASEVASVIGAGWTRETIARLIAVKRIFDGPVTPATAAQDGQSPA